MKDVARRGIEAYCRDARPGLIIIEDDKVIPAFEFAFEIAVRMARSEAAGQITIWSWKSIMNLHGMWLAGDSKSKIHCWTLGDEVLNGSRDETWLEEIPQEHSWSLCEESDHTAHSVDWFSLLRGCSDVVVLDFRLEFPAMRILNKAAKELGKKVLAYIDQFAVVIGNRPVRSYVELAMNIGVAHGADLLECSENIWRISMHDSGAGMYPSVFRGRHVFPYDCNLLSPNAPIEVVDDFLFGQIGHDDYISFRSEETVVDILAFTNKGKIQ